jgi:RES domain-containing protein
MPTRRYREKGKLGGRWNNPGTPIVYTAGGISLALLEHLAHLEDASILPFCTVFRADIKDNLIETLDEARLPKNWRSSPASASVKALGDPRFKQSRSVVLSVPSAIAHREMNYPVNPAHPDFRRIKITGPIVYEFGPRIKDLARGSPRAFAKDTPSQGHGRTVGRPAMVGAEEGYQSGRRITVQLQSEPSSGSVTSRNWSEGETSVSSCVFVSVLGPFSDV